MTEKFRDTGETYKHLIDGSDRIISVSDNWEAFANENTGSEGCSSDHVIGSSLWAHIRDIETKHLYRLIVDKVRQRKHAANFPFRCDSPAKRRFLNLRVTPMQNDHIEFVSQIVKTETRVAVELLSNDIERSDAFVRMCSMCKKIAISETNWKEVEEAIAELKLFEQNPLPQLTHGICEPCYDSAVAELER